MWYIQPSHPSSLLHQIQHIGLVVGAFLATEIFKQLVTFLCPASSQYHSIRLATFSAQGPTTLEIHF